MDNSETNRPSYSAEEREKQGIRLREFKPSIPVPHEGQRTRTINRLTQNFLQELFNNDRDLPKYIEAAKTDSYIRSCQELKCLRLANKIGKYTHSDASIQAWVRSNFDNINGRLHHIVGRLGSAMAYGFSNAEIIFSAKIPGHKGQWRLKGLNVLDQTRTTFEGLDGEVKYLVYRDGKNVKTRVPYESCLHLVNGYSSNIYNSDFVFGDPEAKTAYKYYLAKQAILAEMMIAAKNNATGILLGKVDSNEWVEMTDAQGKPIVGNDGQSKTEPAAMNLLRQLIATENNSVIVTDNKNNVTPLIMPTSEGFWNMSIEILNKHIQRAYGIPSLMFEEGSSSMGMNSLGKQHSTVLDAQIESLVQQLQDQLIEKIVRPLLVYNFGIKDDFGEFQSDRTLDPEVANIRIQSLISAMSAQVIPTTNLNVINSLLSLLDVPTLTETDWAYQVQRDIAKQTMVNQAMYGQM
jgi:hypothetical protein